MRILGIESSCDECSAAVVEDGRRIVGAFCPGVLFPYARQAISDMILRGGFPPFLLPPVNFDGLFQQSIEQARQQAAQQGGAVN